MACTSPRPVPSSPRQANGFYAIEREVRDDPIRDIREAVDFLRGL